MFLLVDVYQNVEEMGLPTENQEKERNKVTDLSGHITIYLNYCHLSDQKKD